MASGIVRKAMVYLGLSDDEFESYDEREFPSSGAGSRRYQPEGADSGPVSAVRPLPRDPSADPSNGFTLTPRPSVVRQITPVQSTNVHVVAPAKFSDAKEIGDRIRNGQPVIVNLQPGDRELSRRMIDFCSGVTYGLGGSMDKVADQVFLLTPSDVEVSPQEKRRLQERGLYRS